MANKVLVAYATKHGSTAGIAQKIGEVLVNAGLDTDVVPVEEINNLSDYRAVIIGSAVYMGKWRRSAARFLKRNASRLADKEVWIFSSGPTDKGNPYELVEGWLIPRNLQSAVDRIQPHDLAVFHGRLDDNLLSNFENAIIKNVNAPLGDFRDWEMIAAWAEGIAAALKS